LWATGGEERALPGVPTVAESGFPELTTEDDFSLFYPVQTPSEFVPQVEAAVRAGLQEDKVKEAFRQLTYKPNGADPAAFARRVLADYERWRKVAASSGFTIDE
jgi:tripartite-type tricarboxylate transporter receptor subunit TctC